MRHCHFRLFTTGPVWRVFVEDGDQTVWVPAASRVITNRHYA